MRVIRHPGIHGHTARHARRFATVLAGAVCLLVTVACASSTEPRERVLTLEVAPTRVECVGVVPMECLQVREVRSGPEQPFVSTFIPIEGFTHEAGYRYVIRVARRTVRNPPADGSSIVDRLLEVVSRTRVQ